MSHSDPPPASTLKPGLALATQALASAGGWTFICSTSILKAHLPGGGELTSPSVSVSLSAAVSCCDGFLFRCSELLCCS